MMFILNIIGAWLIAANINPLVGFYFFLFGNLFGVIFSYMIKANWMLVLNVVFMGVNVKGITTW